MEERVKKSCEDPPSGQLLQGIREFNGRERFECHETVEESRAWLVYIILCSDDSLYTGITTDLPRRFGQHLSGHGAKYFRGRCPLEVLYREGGHTRSSASRREREIKALDRAGKLSLIATGRNGAGRQEQRPS